MQQTYYLQISNLIVNGAKYSPQYSNLHIQMLLLTHFLNVRFHLTIQTELLLGEKCLNFPVNIFSSLETIVLVLNSTDDGLFFGIMLCENTEKLTKNHRKRNA